MHGRDMFCVFCGCTVKAISFTSCVDVTTLAILFFKVLKTFQCCVKADASNVAIASQVGHSIIY
jgi:hypothetical protein